MASAQGGDSKLFARVSTSTLLQYHDFGDFSIVCLPLPASVPIASRL